MSNLAQPALIETSRMLEVESRAMCCQYVYPCQRSSEVSPATICKDEIDLGKDLEHWPE